MAQQSTVNVCFHGIGQPQRELEPGESPYWIEPDLYSAILDEIATWPRCSISFDDGNDSDIELGLPGLVDRGLQASFFVLAGRLEAPGSLSRTGLAELTRNGMTVGTHGMDHRPWTDLDAAGVVRELDDARGVLADALAAPVTDAACPLGRYDRTVIKHLKDRGYRRVFTSDRGVARSDAWLQPRFSVKVDDTPAGFRTAVEREQALHRRLPRAAWLAYKRRR